MVHDALEKWYPPGRERGVHPAKTFQELVDSHKETAEGYARVMWDQDGDYAELEELGLAMLEGYVEEYGEDPHIEIIQPEQDFQIDIYDPETNKYVVTAVGTFDAIYFDHIVQKYGLLEHKTWKSVRTKHLQLDEQASTYWALAAPWLREQGFFKDDEDISVMLYNVLRKSLPDERPRNEKGQYLNQNGSVSKRQPAPYFERIPIYRDVHDREALIRRLVQEATEIKMAREGDLAVYKNPTYSCPYDCDFFDICELHEVGGDWEEFMKMTTDAYDPYAHHADVSRIEED